MDGELAENEAAEVEQHVRGLRSSAEAASRRTRKQAANSPPTTTATTQTAIAAKPHRKLPRWVPVVAATAAAAAIVLLALLPRSAKPVPGSSSRQRCVQPPIALGTCYQPLKPGQRRHVAAHRKAPSHELGDGRSRHSDRHSRRRDVPSRRCARGSQLTREPESCRWIGASNPSATVIFEMRSKRRTLQP